MTNFYLKDGKMLMTDGKIRGCCCCPWRVINSGAALEQPSSTQLGYPISVTLSYTLTSIASDVTGVTAWVRRTDGGQALFLPLGLTGSSPLGTYTKTVDASTGTLYGTFALPIYLFVTSPIGRQVTVTVNSFSAVVCR